MNNDMLRKALNFAADIIELADDATMRNQYMLDASECAGIIRALVDSPCIRAFASSAAHGEFATLNPIGNDYEEPTP